MDKIKYHYCLACELAAAKVEKMARAILKAHPHYDEFIMAMGSYSFTNKKGESIDTTTSVYRNGNYSCDHTYGYFAPLNEFISEWDSYLKITGDAMRFTATGKKK